MKIYLQRTGVWLISHTRKCKNAVFANHIKNDLHTKIQPFYTLRNYKSKIILNNTTILQLLIIVSSYCTDSMTFKTFFKQYLAYTYTNISKIFLVILDTWWLNITPYPPTLEPKRTWKNGPDVFRGLTSLLGVSLGIKTWE